MRINEVVEVIRFEGIMGLVEIVGIVRVTGVMGGCEDCGGCVDCRGCGVVKVMVVMRWGL